MAALDATNNPSLLQFFAWKLGKAMDRKASKEKHARTVVQASIRVLLHIVGFSCLTIAGFYWHVVAGLVVAGSSCFVMAWLLGTTTVAPAPSDNLPPQLR